MRETVCGLWVLGRPCETKSVESGAIVKLRRLPEDFRVEELTSVEPGQGPFSLYRLTKQSIGTPEAIAAIVERWKIPRRRISYGGLKDRHAITVQYLTIHNGPRKALQQSSFQLDYVGQTKAAFTPAEIHGNRFLLVLRDMPQPEVEYASAAVAELKRTGLPNYYDDQRFGSLGFSGDWIGRAWCLGDYERALWLAMADPHRNDSSSEKKQKQIMRDLWGRWPECKQALDRSHRRSVVTFLSDKVESGRDPDYRGAFARISVDLRGLYLSAYQSALWNRLLTRYLESHGSGEAVDSAASNSRVEFRLLSGRCVFPANACENPTLELPLPSARIDPPEGQVGELLGDVLREEDIELRQLRVKYPRDSFFSKGTRPALIQPRGLSIVTSSDELHPNRSKMTLSFELPRGSYATILVKRLTLQPDEEWPE